MYYVVVLLTIAAGCTMSEEQSTGPRVHPLVGMTYPDAKPGVPSLQGAWIRCDQWPDSKTPESFAKDILRLETHRIKTEEDKAVMLYLWLTRCYRRAASPFEGPPGLEGHLTDEWKDFHVYGQGLCDRWGRLGALINRGAGFPARKASSNHTMYEVYYKDTDGKSRWHLLDPHLGWYVYSPDGSHIMSVKELADNTEAFFKFSKTSIPFHVRDPMPRKPELPSKREIRDKKVWFKRIMTSKVWSSKHSMTMNIPEGGSFTRYWYPKPGFHYMAKNKKHNYMHCKYMYHDPTKPKYNDGKIKDPENYYYWEPYRIDCPCGEKNVLPQGHGVFTWRVPLTGSSFGKEAWLCENAISEEKPGSPLVHPAREKEQTTLIYEITSPYIITSATIKADIWRKSTRHMTELAFLFSVDNGNSWHNAFTAPRVQKDEPFPVEIDIGRERWDKVKPTVKGTYGYLLRIDMLGADNADDVGLESLEIENVVQLNMFTLPFLVPGKNKLHITADAWKKGKQYKLTYCWDDPSGKDKLFSTKINTFPASFTVDMPGSKPNDIRLKYVKLEVEGPPQPERKHQTAAKEKIRDPKFYSVTVPEVSTPPKLDGKPDEPVWQKSGQIKALIDNNALVTRKGETRTEIYVCRDQNNLYIAFACRELGADPLAVIEDKRDGKVWADNCAEIYLSDAKDADTYWQIVVNSLGTVMDTCLTKGKKKGDASKNLAIQCKGIRTEKGWSAELSVPLKELGITKETKSIRANFFRVIWGDRLGRGSFAEQEQAFSPVPGGKFNTPDRFGYLTFKP
jgi:hypothetical protein